MSFFDKLTEISNSIPNKMRNIQTEESTKTAFVLPFISALGYDVFDPSEVVPEFTADIGTKKGEKVDYAIIIDKVPTILIECKNCRSDLNIENTYQLCRYFFVTPAKFGVLTNGIIYKFYTDIDEKNKMDSHPFLEIDMSSLNEEKIDELKIFTKASFDLDNITTTANELKYKRKIKKVIREQINDPSDDFVKFFGKKIYNGILTQNIKDQFIPLIKSSFNEYIKEQVDKRLKTALYVSETGETPSETNKPVDTQDEINEINSDDYKYRGTRITSFTLKNKEYKTSNWINLLFQICNLMFDENSSNFDKILDLKGRDRPYFSRNPERLRTSKIIPGSNIYMETNLNANNIVRLSRKVIHLFGYHKEDLIINNS